MIELPASYETSVDFNPMRLQSADYKYSRHCTRRSFELQ